ncbi:hypothetical protein N658DRAFT_563903 [Parathielavia hyrcaniae]|uniref:tRNA (guanine-N(7)-)-methyltransferase non-catalytic subunit n=1 Tax=Parathielavia hyrcaniae TaxID=113614 RepID=A0AAN6T648_9PEZI|nr:hypothetical protein N658DRAFT_563903 [Parathielavia hyrcaniae]
MRLPYHLVKGCGGFVFAAQGCQIHSFSSGLEHVSTWRHPEDKPNEPSAEPQSSPAPEGPPTKRRKVEDGQDSASNGQPVESANGKPKSRKVAQYDCPANERPFIQGLYATTDGRHLIAITGSDKTIWVFEHDGAGNLKQLSQRAMPKRPCALTITTGNRTILSADKFGDVFALPLLPSSTPESIETLTTITTTTTTQSPPRSTTPSTQPPSRSATPSAKPFKPQADPLTVHTGRNLKALEAQKTSLARREAILREQQQQAAAANRPPFDHTLLLGHVSMLTAICVGTTFSAASSDGRRREYIITADRDEHIRVSRGMPQAHVIEGFCLGHEDFVSRLCVAPGGRAEVLIAGGGDDDLFVWDWLRGRLLGRAGVLEHVRKGVAGQEAAGKVAVTRVLACGWEEGARVAVFVVVERVPALLHYELLEDNTLQHRETIPLPGDPLDVEAIETPGATARLLVAVYPTEQDGSSLITLDKDEAGWRQGRVENLPAGGDVKIGHEELQKILYSTESLRKSSDFD